jgi:integrase
MSSRTKIGQLAVHQRHTKTAKGNIKTYYYARGTVRFKTEKESVDEILKGITSISQAEIETQNVEIRWLKLLKDRYLNKNPDFMTFKKMSNQLLDDHMEAPSVSRQSTFIKNADILKDKLLAEIKQKDITEVAFIRYPKLLPYKGKRLNTINNLDEREKISGWFSTANTNVMIPIGKVLHYAHQQGLCPYIKVKYFETLNSRNRRRPKYSAEEIKKCMEYETKDFGIVSLFVFLLFSGLRVSEALRIHWLDLDIYENKVIDLDNRTLNIFANKTGTWIKKPMHPILFAWLDKVEDKTGYLFEWRSLHESKNAERGIIKRWNAMQEFAGIEHHKRKKRHALRHTITSMLSDNGASLQELMAFNGWSDERSALGYTETGQDKLAKLINKIN